MLLCQMYKCQNYCSRTKPWNPKTYLRFKYFSTVLYLLLSIHQKDSMWWWVDADNTEMQAQLVFRFIHSQDLMQFHRWDIDTVFMFATKFVNRWVTVSLENGTAAIPCTDFSGSWHSAISTIEDLFIYQLLCVLL